MKRRREYESKILVYKNRKYWCSFFLFFCFCIIKKNHQGGKVWFVFLQCSRYTCCCCYCYNCMCKRALNSILFFSCSFQLLFLLVCGYYVCMQICINASTSWRMCVCLYVYFLHYFFIIFCSYFMFVVIVVLYIFLFFTKLFKLDDIQVAFITITAYVSGRCSTTTTTMS